MVCSSLCWVFILVVFFGVLIFFHDECKFVFWFVFVGFVFLYVGVWVSELACSQCG